MVRKLFYLFLLLVISLLFYIGFHPKSNYGQIAHAGNPALITVRDYVYLSSLGNWNKALGFLSGEALQDAEINLKRNPEVKSSLELKVLEVISLNDSDNFTVVRAHLSRGEDNKTIYYYLRKLGGRWLIYKMSYKDPELPGVFKSSVMEPGLTRFMKERFDITRGHEALSVTKNPSDGLIKGLTFTCLGSSGGFTLVEATYTLNSTLSKPQNRRVIYILVEDRGTWRVAAADVVQISN